VRESENGRDVGVVEDAGGFGRVVVEAEGFGEVIGVELDCEP